MSKPLNVKTHDAAAATGSSAAVRAKGHFHVSLFVSAPNVDTANDSLTVRVEGSPDGSTWVPLKNEADNTVEVTQTDFSNGVAHVMVKGVMAQQLRVNLSTYTDAAGADLAVTAWLVAGGWNGPAFGV